VPTALVHATNSLKPSTGNPVITADGSTSPPESKAERKKVVLSNYNDVPIDFYGKLEDQSGNAVVGAEIKGSIMVNNGQREGTDQSVTTSDANGLFQFHGKGQNLGMMPHKSGYALATTGTLFNFSHLEEHPYVSDENNPTVVRMWKLAGAEPLVGINQHFKVPVTGSPVGFDLLAGSIVPTGGDLKMTITRSPGIISGRNRLDWGVEVEAVDGGLIETSMAEARVMYGAPETGYQANDTFIMSTNVPHKWFGGFDQMFFVQSRNGQVYSKVFISFNINQNPADPMSITMRGVASTNGSRNWEGDPNSMNTATAQ
jgi:hypothetical protein